MRCRNTLDSQRTKNMAGATQLIECLASNLELSPALSLLNKLFPTHSKEIANRRNRSYNVLRTTEADCDIVDLYITYSGDINAQYQTLLNACLGAIVGLYYNSKLYLNPVELSRFLIERGADVNTKDELERTLLHFLIGSEWSADHRSDCLEMIKYVLRKGADPLIKNKAGHDAVVDACYVCRQDIIYLIYKASPPDRTAKVIESLEFYGTHNLLFLRNLNPTLDYSLGEGIGAWLLAIRLKQSIEKKALSDEEFQQMFPSMDSALLHAMNSHDKILSREHEKSFILRLRCIVRYAEMRDYRKWLGILKECFVQIFSLTLSSCERNQRLYHFVDGLNECFASETISDDIRRELSYADVSDYLQIVIETVIEIRQNQKHEPLSEEAHINLLSLISYIIMLFCFLNSGTPEKIDFKRLVCNAMSLNLATIKGRTLMLKTLTTIERCIKYAHVHVLERYKYISRAAKLFLECGVDANERDFAGNTVLHRIAIDLWSESLRTDQPNPEEKEVVQALVDYGLHFDARNCNGIMVSDILLQRYGIEISGVMDLRCLAARVIRSQNIPYVGIIPKDLYDFVEMH